MRFFLTILLLTLFGCDQQPLIDDYKIEGISTGDSLLDLLSVEEIEAAKVNSKRGYAEKNDHSFFRSYYDKNLKKYDYLSFHSLTNDEKYEIKGIFGHRNFKDKKSCLEEQNKIKEEFSNLYKNTEKTSGEKYYGETTSTFTYNYFDFPSGERISVQCYFFESGKIRLSIALVSSVELIKWLEDGNRSTSNEI